MHVILKMATLDDIKSAVSKELEQFEVFYQNALHSDNFLLDKIGRYTLKHKGKQLRPLFVFLSAKCFGEVNESTYRAATFIELLHSATLIHDDVVDDAAERRGFASINAMYKNKIAVLAGDYLLSKGMMIALENRDYQMLDMISETVRNMSEGEIFQLEKAKKFDISEDDYYQIIEKKTAALIASCCAIGAVSTCANSAQVEAMRQFGINAGTAFQIRDDIFDYYDSTEIGKPTGNDMAEGKLTLPVIYALNHSDFEPMKSLARKVKLGTINVDEIAVLVEFAKQSGGIQYAERMMDRYSQKAKTYIDTCVKPELKEAYETYLEYVIRRKL